MIQFNFSHVAPPFRAGAMALAAVFLFLGSLAYSSEVSTALAYRPARAKESAHMPLTEMADKWNLVITSSARSNRVELAGESVDLVLVPGLPMVQINKRTRMVSTAPHYEGNALHIPREVFNLLPRPQAVQAARLATDMVVVLDPGHGGRDPGAIGYGGVKEKDVNLAVSLYVREYLSRAGVAVRMTRTRDTFPSLEARADMANRTPKSVFVSIHANAARDRSARGVETFVLSRRISDSYRTRQARSQYPLRGVGHSRVARACREARSESLELARAVQGNLARASGDEDRGVRSQNLHVLRESYFSPAVLVELGFLTHPASARRLASRSYQRRLAKSIADGLLRYLQQNGTDQSAWKDILPEGTRLASRR